MGNVWRPSRFLLMLRILFLSRPREGRIENPRGINEGNQNGRKEVFYSAQAEYGDLVRCPKTSKRVGFFFGFEA